MNTSELVARVVRKRSSVFSSLPNALEGFDRQLLFNVFVEFFDAIVNEPMIDISNVKPSGEKISLIGEDGKFKTLVDAFVVRDAVRADSKAFNETFGAGAKDVLMYFRRLPPPWVGLPTVDDGDTITDVFGCTGIISVCNGATIKLHPRVPLFICGVLGADGGMSVGLDMLGYNGEYADYILPAESADKILVTLATSIWASTLDASTLVVPAVRRKLIDVAKGEHRV